MERDRQVPLQKHNDLPLMSHQLAARALARPAFLDKAHHHSHVALLEINVTLRLIDSCCLCRNSTLMNPNVPHNR